MSSVAKKLLCLVVPLSISACALMPEKAVPKSTLAESRSSELPIPQLHWSQHTLDNGLTLIVHEDPKAPVAGVYVWYRVGSKDERPGRTGFAHLFEHLLFTGTENYDGEFFEPLIAVGATGMNGTTSVDRTNYYQTVPTPALDRALWLESERMGHFLGAMTEDKLAREKGVVANEYRQGRNRPYGGMWDRLVEATYPQGHPYSWPTIGRVEDVQSASMDDVHEWFEQHYGAANAVLVIAGDVDTDDVRERVAHYFGDIAPGPAQHDQVQHIARMQEPRREIMQDRVPQARLLMAWNIPPAFNDTTNDLELVAELLSSGRSSPLRRILVEEEELATSVSAGVWAKSLGSQFLIDATAAPGVTLSELEDAIDRILQDFLRDGPEPDALARAKVRLYASTVRGLQDVGGNGKADLLARSLVLGGDPDAWRRQLAHYRAATPSSLRDSADAWLDDGRYVLEVHPRPDFSAAATGADRSRMPEPSGDPPPLTLPDSVRFTLSNGLQVQLAERNDVPQVEFRLMVDAGHAADPVALPGLASLAETLRTRGTPSRDAITISDDAAALGALLSASTTRDHSIISVGAVHPFVADSVALLADVLRQPSFPADELERAKRRRLAAIAQEKADPNGLVARHLAPLIYGDGHPYAQPASGTGTVAAIEAITEDDLHAYQRQWIRPERAELLVVGDIAIEPLRELLEAELGDWQPGQEPPPSKRSLEVAPPGTSRIVLIDQPGAEQSVVVAARTAPPTGSDDDIAFDIVNEVLGGSFIARLNQELRVARGWSYGVGSGLGDARGPRVFYVYGAVQTDRTADSVGVIRDELAAILDARPPTEAELEAAARSLTLTLPGNNQTLTQVTSTLDRLLRFDLPANYYRDYVPAVNGISAERVSDAAGRLIDPEATTWLVVGDRARIEAPLRALDIGDITILSPGMDN